MNAFKAACIKLATEWDYNAKCVKRRKGDGKKIRRYARRKLKRKAIVTGKHICLTNKHIQY